MDEKRVPKGVAPVIGGDDGWIEGHRDIDGNPGF